MERTVVNVMKRRAGSDSHGNTWEHDGAVVDVEDPDVAAALIALPDGGFELAPDEEDLPPSTGPDDTNRPGGVPVHVKAGSEPDSGDVVEVDEEPASDAAPDAAADAAAEGDQEPPAPAKASGRRAPAK
jgi:hypothetical protein